MSFRGGSKSRTSDVQLDIGESLNSGGTLRAPSDEQLHIGE